MATGLQLSPVQVKQPEKPLEQLILQPERGLALAHRLCYTLCPPSPLPRWPCSSSQTLGTNGICWIHGVWVCISTGPGLWSLSPRLFLSVRGTYPLPPGLPPPVQHFSLAGGIAEPVTKIHHTRDGSAPSRSQRSRSAPCRAPLWFGGSPASPAPSTQPGEHPPATPQPCTPGTPALRISG